MVNSAKAYVEQSIKNRKAKKKQEITVGTRLLFLWSTNVETSSTCLWGYHIEGLEVIKLTP